MVYIMYIVYNVYMDIEPRPALKLDFHTLPKNVKIFRIEMFRIKRKWYELWKPKYKIKYLALTESAVYDISESIK